MGENNVPVLERAVSTFQEDLLPIKSGSNLWVSSLLCSSESILCDNSVTNRILFREFAMTYTTRSGGVKFLHPMVRNFVCLSTMTPLCEVELQLYQFTQKHFIMQRVSEGL